MTKTMYVLSEAQKDVMESHNGELEAKGKRVEPVKLLNTYIPVADGLFPAEDFTAGVWFLPTSVCDMSYDPVCEILQGMTTTDIWDEYFPDNSWA